MSAPLPRATLRGTITYEEATNSDHNILLELQYPSQRDVFFENLNSNRDRIQRIVGRHLGLPARMCKLADRSKWIHGSFNVCILVETWNKAFVLRFPLPYRIGDFNRRGNSDEKVRCEVGTYAWIQRHCPDVPIPHLVGFGLADGNAYSHLYALNIFSQSIELLRRTRQHNTNDSHLSKYVKIPCNDQASLKASYILMRYVDDGKSLSRTWREKRTNPELRANLFRSLSRVMLSLSRHRLPRIGSFAFEDDCFIRLANRPLTMEVMQSENEHTNQEMRPRDLTYSSASSYIHDVFTLHDNRFRFQPNAINDREDAVCQLETLRDMRNNWHHFFNTELHGPFVFSLTDITQNNIFVDEAWNITAIIDLEWACALPIEMLHPPYWLTDQGVDEIDEHEYRELHTEFMQNLQEVEAVSTCTLHPTSDLHAVMKKGLEEGTLWFSLALSSPSGLFSIWENHIQSRFFVSDSASDDSEAQCSADSGEANTHNRNRNSDDFIEQKMKDKQRYDDDLLSAFQYTN